MLYDFRDAPEELKKYEEDFWLAADFVEEEKESLGFLDDSGDFIYQYLVNVYLSDKIFLLIPK